MPKPMQRLEARPRRQECDPHESGPTEDGRASDPSRGEDRPKRYAEDVRGLDRRLVSIDVEGREGQGATETGPAREDSASAELWPDDCVEPTHEVPAGDASAPRDLVTPRSAPPSSAMDVMLQTGLDIERIYLSEVPLSDPRPCLVPPATLEDGGGGGFAATTTAGLSERLCSLALPAVVAGGLWRAGHGTLGKIGRLSERELRDAGLCDAAHAGGLRSAVEQLARQLGSSARQRGRCEARGSNNV
ncbi:uncharacterized protein LOC133351167 isoform X2 [Lethenteron reissneri]|uniref:uncharacterized protein LOC133351167 isoform X2 n=1 Tax=Lethenteron reissneri TaxID=7753 RepID=UPI002AB6D978|nr:uncharacterized protein LOC133351167 isoform X2 [Lethenteron reissneri]